MDRLGALPSVARAEDTHGGSPTEDLAGCLPDGLYLPGLETHARILNRSAASGKIRFPAAIRSGVAA
jgi:hypothetical protein